jgi:Zn-dependent protease with chaperone function
MWMAASTLGGCERRAGMEMQTEIEQSPLNEAPPLTQYFNRQMPPVRVSFGYRLGLFLVAVAMVLLPLIYLGCISCLCWGLYLWAARAGNWFFPEVHGTRRIFGVLLIWYVTPLFAGLILVLFMLKSFFTRWQVEGVSMPISHEDHPEVFRFLGQLCQQVGAPIPSRVDVSLDINAGAGLREGFASFFGNDVCLNIGLPLAAAVNCREFAGLMAHELGHFTQRAGLRCDFIINSINGWLLRAVYTRDDFDASLEEASSESAFGLVIFTLGRIAIAFTRGIMWLLLMLGHALSSYMLRQMEFHADACEIAVSGTDGFVAMSRKLLVLHACAEQARTQFRNQVCPKYPDDFSAYIAMLAAQCAGQTKGKLLNAAARKKTRWFFSHPSDAERMARAMQAAQPGIIEDERPATVLFNDFAGLSRALTLASYQMRRRGKPLSPDQLFSVEQPVAEAAPDTSAEEAAIHKYFGGLGNFLRPVLLGPEARLGIGLTSEKIQQLRLAKETLHSSELAALCESLTQLDAKKVQALGASAFIQAGVPFEPETFPLIPTDGSKLPETLRSLQTQEEELIGRLAGFESAAKMRLVTGLSLLRTPSMAAVIPNTQQLQDQVLDWLHALGKISAAFPWLIESREEIVKLNAFLALRARTNSELLDAALAQTVERSKQLLSEMHNVLGSTAYPFQHPRGHISISEYAQAKEFDADPARMLKLEFQSHLQMLFALYYRLLGGLVGIACQVEQQLENPQPT